MQASARVQARKLQPAAAAAARRRAARGAAARNVRGAATAQTRRSAFAALSRPNEHNRAHVLRGLGVKDLLALPRSNR